MRIWDLDGFPPTDGIPNTLSVRLAVAGIPSSNDRDLHFLISGPVSQKTSGSFFGSLRAQG